MLEWRELWLLESYWSRTIPALDMKQPMVKVVVLKAGITDPLKVTTTAFGNGKDFVSRFAQVPEGQDSNTKKFPIFMI